MTYDDGGADIAQMLVKSVLLKKKIVVADLNMARVVKKYARKPRTLSEAACPNVSSPKRLVPSRNRG